MKELNYGKDYKYAHDYPGNFVEMEFMPQELKQHIFYKHAAKPLKETVGNG